jgi:NAD(P)H-dependent FMN reductase
VIAQEHTPTVVRPCLRRADFADPLARWLEEGLAARRDHAPAGAAAVVLVPEYVHAGAVRVLADLARRDWTGTVVAVVGYGGRTRGRYAIEDAREVLLTAGAQVLGHALGIDAARVRAHGFEAADVLLRDAVLDDLVASGPVTTIPPRTAD